VYPALKKRLFSPFCSAKEVPVLPSIKRSPRVISALSTLLRISAAIIALSADHYPAVFLHLFFWPWLPLQIEKRAIILLLQNSRVKFLRN